MKSSKLRAICILFSLGLISFISISWGIFGHEHINKSAVFALPQPLQTFFYNHIDFVTQEATVPDLRKYTLKDKTESPRHYFDVENFGIVDSIPRNFEVAKKKYDQKFLNDNGILPWYIQEMMTKLTKAFKDKRKTEILFLASDLGHYIGDAHMPLHTSANHDGQLTNQKGIHALWEARIPELYGKNYNFHTEEAHYIENVEQATWALVMDSHSLVAPLLLADKKTKESFPAESVFLKDDKGNIARNKFNDPLFADEFTKKFNEEMNGMVENQMKKAIVATSSFWYTAWINAGKPNLDDLDLPDLTQRNKKLLKQDLKLWNKGKIFGLESEKDF
jgi:hypothetical protein